MTVKTILTTDPEYQNILGKYNASICDFIKANPKLVEYDTDDNGYSTITLEYGQARDKTLKEIAKIANDTLNDTDFKIDGLTCELIYANSSILRFRGLTSEIEHDLKTISTSGDEEKIDIFKSLVHKTNVDDKFDLTNYADKLEKFFKKYVLNKSSHDDKLLTEAGFTYKSFGTKGYFGIDVNEMAKCNDMKAEYNVIVKPLLKLHDKKSELLNDKLDNKLSEIGLNLERVNEYSIMFSYELNEYNEDVVKKDFNYRVIPGAITRLFVHIGKAENISVNKLLNTDANYEFDDPEATPEKAEDEVEENNDEIVIDADGAIRSKYDSEYVRLNEVYESIVIECNIRMSDTYAKVLDTLKNDIRFRKLIDVDIDSETGKYIKVEEPKYFDADYFTESNSNDSVFDEIWKNALWISDSTLTFNNFDTNGLGSSTALIQHFGDSITFENFDVLPVEELNSGYCSNLHNGVSIIKKAIESGRALDICIPYKDRASDDGFYYSDYLDYIKSRHDAAEDESPNDSEK